MNLNFYILGCDGTNPTESFDESVGNANSYSTSNESSNGTTTFQGYVYNFYAHYSRAWISCITNRKETKATDFEMRVREDIHTTSDQIQYEFVNTDAAYSDNNILIGKIFQVKLYSIK